MIRVCGSSFTLDSVGNTTVKWHQTALPLSMSYDGTSRIVTAMDGATLVTYTFDANGNMTVENRGGISTNYSYDNENRLSVQTDPDGTKTTMSYQGSDGLRRSRWTPSVWTTFIWDGSDYLGEVR